MLLSKCKLLISAIKVDSESRFKNTFHYLLLMLFWAHVRNYYKFLLPLWTAEAQLCGRWKVLGSISAVVSGFFIDIESFRSHYGPGVDSASNRNEYQEHFLG